MTAGLKLALGIDGEKAVVDGIGRVADQIDRTTMSAKAMAAATRGIGPQFTDIFTSLASGQEPMTVLIQQGGQLKDMFGGIGPAARALGGYVAGLVNPFTSVAAAAGAAAFAYHQGSAEADGYTRSIVMTGNAAGVTAGQLATMAARLDGTVGTHHQAALALAAFAGTGRVAGSEIERYTAIALRAERDIGQSVDDTAKHFADLAKDPVAASLKLTDSLGYLTVATLSQIRAAKAMGDEDRAAAIAQDAYANALSTRAAQMEGSLGTIERAWRSLKTTAAEAWDSMLGIGRAATIQQQLASVNAAIAQASGQDANRRHQMPWDDNLDALRQRQAYLQEMARLEQRGAAAAAERTANERAGLEAVKAVAAANEKARTTQEQMNKALGEYRRQLEDIRRVDPNNALLNPATVAKTEASIREQFKIKGKADRPGGDPFAADRSAAQAWQKAMEDAARITADATAKVDGLSDAQRVLRDYQASFAYVVNEQTNPAMNAAVEKALTAAAASRAQEAAQRAATEAVQDAKKAHEDLIGTLTKSADSVAAHADDIARENEAAAMAVTWNLSLAQALQKVAIARLQEKQIAMMGNEEAVLAIQREIDQRERLIGLIGSKEAREANEKAAKDSADAWQKSFEDGSKSLADALMRGGKSGREYIKNLLRQPFNIVLQATVQSVAGSVPGLFGMPSAVGGVGGAGMGGLGGMAAMSMAGNPFAMGFSGAWGAGGGLMSTIGAGTSLIGSGQIGAGLGVWAGAAMPILAGLSMLASLDDSGTLHTGAAASSDGTRAKRIEAPSIGTQGIVVSADTQQTVNQLAVGGAGVLNTTARNFGKAGGYSMATAYADDSSADGAWGGMVIEQGGAVRQDWRNGQTSRWAPREFSDGAAGRQEYEQALAQGLRQELLAMDLPGWASDMLNELGDTPGMQELLETVGQINELQATFGALGQSLVDFASMGDAALLKLVSASGGSANLLAQVSSYEAKYYTQAERRAAIEQKLHGELGKVNLQMPTMRQEYRAMMDAAVDMGEAGVQTQAVLLANADAFAELTPEVEEATEVVKRSAADIARERDSLQRRYLQLIGDQTALRELDLAALDESNRALQRQIWAEEDRQAVLAEATRAQDEYNRSLASAQSWLAGVTRSIREFVRGGLGSNEPQSSVSPALAAYREQYRLAASGDRDALQNITAAAQKVVSAAEQRMGSTQARQLIAQLGGELLALPGMVSAEQFIADSVTTAGAQTTGAVQALPAQLDTLIGGRLAAGFAMIDANADEQVSRSEFMTAFGALGTEATLGAIFAKLDTNGDGQISRLEAVDGKLGRSNQELGWLRGDLAHMANIAAESWHVQAAIRGDLAYIGNLMNAGLTVRSEFRAGSMQTFATGGAFGAGAVVRRPTAFPIGLMGEAGPEAILPLTSIGGTLGVRAIGGAGVNDRLERLLRELVTETTRQGYELRAVAKSNNAIALRMREFELRGMMVRPTPDEPLAVGVVA